MTRPPTRLGGAREPAVLRGSQFSVLTRARTEREVRWSLAVIAVMDAPRSCICFGSASSSDDHGRLSSWRGIWRSAN